MLFVRDILALPCFADARSVLASNAGLDRPVEGVGLFDYEPLTEGYDTFTPNEVLLTGMGFSRADESLGELALLKQIEQGIAAIFIKDKLFDDVTDRVRTAAEEAGTPLFFFTESYMEDAVTEVKNLIVDDKKNASREEVVDALLHPGGAEERRRLFHEKTGLMGGCVACATFVGCEGWDALAASAAESAISAAMERCGVPGGYMCRYRGFLLALMVFDSPCDEVDSTMQTRCSELCRVSGMLLSCGYGDAVAFEDVARSIEQALRTAERLKHDGHDAGRCWFPKTIAWSSEGWAAFSDAAKDSAMLSSLSKRYRNELARYDDAHDMDLLNTMRCFVACAGAAPAVAETLHLHPNSVRNRVTKAKEVLGRQGASDRVFYAFLVLVFLDDDSEGVASLERDPKSM